MSNNANRKCRTCLKMSMRTFPLNKYASGCSPKRTYAQLLIEFAKFEFVVEQERNLPQELCKLCCRQLNNMFAFVRQAQHCNRKLITIAKKKQLDCLQEQTIDLPSIELDTTCDIKVENNGDVMCNTDNVDTQKSMSDGIKVKSEEDAANNLFLKTEFSDETLNDGLNCVASKFAEKDDADGDILSNDFSKETSATSDKIFATELNDTTGSSETLDLKLVCPICKKLVSRRDNLIKHMRVQHEIRDPSKLLEKQKPEPKEPIYHCEFCPCKYTNKYTHLKHLKNKHGINQGKTNETIKFEKKIIKCKFCDYIAKTYGALHYHIKYKHGTDDDKFKCNFCSFTRFKKFDLLGHIKNEHKDVVRNLRWEKENKIKSASKNSTILQDSLTKVDIKNRKEKSEMCNSTNIQDSCIEKSKAAVNDENTSDDDIPLSQKAFKSKEIGSILDMENESSDEEFIRDLLNIKRRQTKSEPTRSLARCCDECGKIFKNQYALTAHKQRHIEITEDKYSLCPHCGNKYKRPKDLKGHIKKAHTNNPQTDVPKPPKPPKVREKRFMCTECSYVCINMALLRIHMNRHHTGEKPFKCDVCDQSFVVKFDLKTHYYLHTGERPFKCPICYKGFRHHTHMMKHKIIHSSIRPYNCSDCGKGFTKSYNLKVHNRTHLKQKSFE